jgi:nucleotide-binding universal stress UspA family protein
VTIQKILVPVDGSESAGVAARFATRLAGQLGATVTLIHVFDAPALTSLGMVAKGNLDETMQYVASGSFSGARAAIGDTTVPIQERVEIGHPAAQIIDYATRCDADLIVMGKRGLSPMKELLVGSVSERVMRSAPCPVTVVHR